MKPLKEYLLKENKKNIPDVVYHATIKQRLSDIKKYGLGGKIPKKRFWDYEGTEYEHIKQGFFVDVNPENAYYYVENSDEIWDAYEDFDSSDIILFSIKTKDLDLSKLHIDSNDDSNEDEPHSYFYDGVVPFEKLTKESTKEY